MPARRAIIKEHASEIRPSGIYPTNQTFVKQNAIDIRLIHKLGSCNRSQKAAYSISDREKIPSLDSL